MIKIFKSFKIDILSGLTAALALVPEAVAFSFVAGVEPLIGLYSAFFVGLITGIFGGRPGMISGATGALAVVIVSLVSTHGVEYLFATVVLMGLIQVLAGVLKFGKFVRLIPHPVMLGFVNGLAIVICLAQFSQFKTVGADGAIAWLSGSALVTMAGLVALTMAIIYFLPKISKAIPSSLAAIFIITGLTLVFGLETRSVKDLATIGGAFPSFHLPGVPFNLETLYIIFPYSLILAAIGLIESLMTLQLVDEITETRGNGNRECMAQGAANIVCGFFSGMGGCAMIGQSMINVKSGGRGRASSISAALFLLLFILAGSQLIGMIPIAALVGVMFMVVIATFEWTSIRMLAKIPKADAFVIILVSAMTVIFDLAIAVASGIIVSALVFAWKKSEHINFTTHIDEEGNNHYAFKGTLFFGSVQSFQAAFDLKNARKKTVLDFKECRLCDHSALEAINTLIEKHKAQNKSIYIKNLSPDCASAVNKAGIFLKN